MRMNMKRKPFLLLMVFFVIAGFFYVRYANKPRDFNVLLITVDALRQDHLGCYGYKVDTSPNIDKFAKDGVLFKQAISQASFTASSFPSIMTSTYPDTHKVREWGDSLDSSLLTLAQALKNMNYYGGVICAHNFFISLLGLERGFDTLNTGIDLSAGEITKQAVLWLERNKSKRFFLWLHYFDPHEPYDPPAHIKKEMNIGSRKRNDREVPILKNDPEDRDIRGGLGGISSYAIVEGRKDMGYYISLYDGEIRYADEQIGVLLNKLKDLKLYGRTLIIITADHGESMGEHDLFFTHGVFLYDPLLKVPLIIGGPSIPKGKVVTQQVQLIDIMPTVLSFLKIKARSGMEGSSLLPLIFNKNSNNHKYAFSEVSGNLKSIRTSDWKLIYDSGADKYELYNLKTDPAEKNNLAGKEKGKFKFLKERLEKWSNRSKPNAMLLRKQIKDQEKDRLRGLGYLQ